MLLFAGAVLVCCLLLLSFDPSSNTLGNALLAVGAFAALMVVMLTPTVQVASTDASHRAANLQNIHIMVDQDMLVGTEVTTIYPCTVSLELKDDADGDPSLYVKNSDIIATPEVLEVLCT